jgi:hypothetical protein
MEALSQNNPPSPSCTGLQPKRSQPFWVQLPDIHPTKVLFAKDKLPDGMILPPVAIGPRAEYVKAFRQDNNPVSVSIPPVTVYKALFTNSSYAYRTWEWFNLLRDDVFRSRNTPPLACWLDLSLASSPQQMETVQKMSIETLIKILCPVIKSNNSMR